MRLYLLFCVTVLGFSTYAQSDRDMIVASWKCVAVEQAPVQPTNKKQKTVAPKADAPNIDSLRKEQLGTVYGFRNNGTVIFNKDGGYEAYQYKVEGNQLSITQHRSMPAIYTIQHLDYRTMVWQGANGLLYRFERE